MYSYYLNMLREKIDQPMCHQMIDGNFVTQFLSVTL